jgi:branched-chain amino acid aminotransferase
MKVWIDGKICGREEATVSVLDHGLLYGDGLFEGIRVYNGRPFRLEAHLERLYRGARAIRLAVPCDQTALEAAVLETVAAAGPETGYIRLLVTRGVGPLGISPAGCTPALIIIADRITLYPEESYRDGIDLHTASVRRIPAECWDVRIKSLNYLNNVLAKLEAQDAGCGEAVLLNQAGRVAECAGDNIFILREGSLVTPPVREGALEGITRGVVLELPRSWRSRQRRRRSPPMTSNPRTSAS